MRIFVLPSWTPTADNPLSGSFFLEQAHAMAESRPGWTVAICLFDMERSRLPWRPQQIPRYVKDCLNTPALVHRRARSGLHQYQVWAPYLPRFGGQIKWIANTKALASQVKPALKEYIRRYGKPDLIHAQAVYPGGAAAVALGQSFGIPVGLTEHMGPFPPPALCMEDGSVMPLLAETYAKVSRCSAVSQGLADRILGLDLMDDVTILPNFLPDSFGSVQVPPQKSCEGFSFLSVGGPSYAKGTDILLKALRQIDPSVTLNVIGDSSETALFQKMADELGVSERVRWLGAVQREKMPAYYQACDAFVLPSRGETFGVAFIEALAFGKPLIATRCGGPEEIVHAGNGLLVPANSVDELVVAMRHMVRCAGLYIPHALRADFLARFSASAVLARIESWYHEIVHSAQHQVTP